jgi:outer membrane lipoprotein carrier protein
VNRLLPLFAAIVLSPLAPSPSVAAGPPPLDRLLGALESSAKEVSTLSGEFVQRSRSSLFNQELRSTGRFFYRRPRQIRWEYLQPDPSTMILDGKQATLSTPGAPPQRFDLERDATMRVVFDQLLLWLLPEAISEARRSYDLSTGGTQGLPQLTLVPKADHPAAKAFQRIDLRVDGKTHLLHDLVLTEKNGDRKEIEFTKMTRNAPLPADAFR